MSLHIDNTEGTKHQGQMFNETLLPVMVEHGDCK